jgi:hypothetical protein
MSAGPSRQDSAQCEVTIAASDGSDKHIDGHYSWVLVREGGSWKFLRDTGDEGTGYTLISACHDRRLDLIYLQHPGLQAGQQFPLWTID